MIQVPTSCKTWRCAQCRLKLISLFKAKVEIGVSRLERCSFITVTYKADGSRTGPPAKYVPEDWRQLLALWRKSNRKGMPWLRVTEVTKRKTPHHHLVSGQKAGTKAKIGGLRCYGRDFDVRSFKRAFDRCDCLSHALSRMWLQVTGDSWLVHVVPVSGAAGAASYMAKYVTKGFGMHPGDRLMSTGMERRYSTSNDWPWGGRMQLRETVENGWERRIFRNKHGDEEGPRDLRERVGEEDVMLRSERVKAAFLTRRLEEKVKHGSDVREADVSDLASGRF